MYIQICSHKSLFIDMPQSCTVTYLVVTVQNIELIPIEPYIIANEVGAFRGLNCDFLVNVFYMNQQSF